MHTLRTQLYSVWDIAGNMHLTAVFAEGIIFILLSVTNVREAIFNAIPKNLKSAVSVGIGSIYRICRSPECAYRYGRRNIG